MIRRNVLRFKACISVRAYNSYAFNVSVSPVQPRGCTGETDYFRADFGARAGEGHGARA